MAASFKMKTEDSFSTNTKYSQLLSIKQKGDLNFNTMNY